MNFQTLENGAVVSEVWQGTFDAKYDVAVAGLGTAGAVAAITAGREGLRVLGIEALSYMGGVGTGGAIHNYCAGTLGGIQDEADARTKAYGKAYAQQGVRGWHPDAKKYALEEMASEVGVEVAYLSKIIGVFCEGTQVKGLQLIGPDGIRNIETQFIIDCTGDGDACVMAGCAYRFGRAFDGQPQPFSMPRGTFNAKGGIDHANFDAGYVDPRDGTDFSEGICRGHTLHLMDRYEEQDRMLYLASCPGLREGRFIVGEETLSYADLIGEKRTDRVIMQMRSFHDNHCRDWAFESDAAQEWVTICGLWSRKTLAEIPYGVVVPKGVEGLLVAGRCVSLDHDSAQSFRMQHDMQKLGEAAAVAAALAIENQCPARAVPIKPLQKKLRDSGCLPEPFQTWEPWCETLEKIKRGLASENAGVAIWSAKRFGSDSIPMLLEALNQNEDALLRVNAAMALAIQGRTECIPVLREMVIARDASMPNQKGNFNQPRFHAAMHLLSRFEDAEIVPELLAIFMDPETDFAALAQAFRALLRIGRARKEIREQIVNALTSQMTHENFQAVMTMQKSTSNGTAVKEEMTRLMRVSAAREFKAWNFSYERLLQCGNASVSFRDERLLRQA